MSGPTRPRAALLTPRGRGAVATIRVQGDCRIVESAAPVLFRARNGKRVSEQSSNRIVFGIWGDEPGEEVVVCRRDDATLDIHCHGGDAATRKILSDLETAGCEVVSWAELIESGEGPFACECAEALSRATTLRAADILLDQCAGTFRAAIEELIATCGDKPNERLRPFARGGRGGRSEDHGGGASELTPSSHRPLNVEHRTSNIEHRTDGQSEILARLDDLLSWSVFGLHLTRPWRLVIAGRPNAGKSSLINALLGFQRSIVYDEPGTTRDVVTANTAFDGWPVQLADTAGIRETAGALESSGIERARAELAEADLRVILLDVSIPAETTDFELLSAWPDALVVAQKVDLPDVRGSQVPDGALRVSSRTGEGVPALEKALAARLVPRVPAPETAVPFTERQIELLRRARQAAEASNTMGCAATLQAIVE